MSDLTLPGSIPGLLRRGSPVVLRFDEHAGSSGVVIQTDVIGVRDGGMADIYEVGHGELFDVAPDQIALDLSDATGRAHAAWWLQAHTQPDAGGLWLDGVTPPEDFRRAWWAVAGRLPIFADLDPDDPRLLPDRSRWVDAEALRRVVLHVAGVTP